MTPMVTKLQASVVFSLLLRMLRYGKKVRKNQRSLQALLALQTINEPICNIIEREFDTLRLLWLKEAKHKGSPCVSCDTQNLVQCPTKNICSGNPCKYHDTSEHQPRACQSLSKSCEYFKTQIAKCHRSRTPNWRRTDAKIWSENATEIAKCFLPQLKEKKTYSADEGTDCLSLLHILRNCKHFQDYFSFDVTGSKNILSQIEKEKMNYNLGYENTPFVQPQSKRRSVDELGPAVKRLKSYPSYKSGISSATFALEKQLESKHMFYHCTSPTEDQQPYEYCMKRVQMALSKWSCTEKVYNGKFELFASKAEYLETLLDNSCRFKQKVVSDVLRTPGSPVLLIVSASDQDKIERFCSQITSKEEEGKHVCVAVVSDRTSIDELCMDQTSLGLFRKWSKISTLRDDVEQLFERFIFNFYETNLHLYFEQKDITEKREEEMIKEALTLFRRFKIEIPVWLEEYGRDFEHKDSTQRLISDFKPAMRRFKQLPFVFDCVPRTGHMIIKLIETDKDQDKEQHERCIKNILNDCKLPEERYQITFVTVTKYADYKYKSGDEVQVKDRTGTLSGFAKMNVSNKNELVAILSNHVAEETNPESKTFSTTLKMQKDNVGEILLRPKGDLKADVAIAKIHPCKVSDCDKKFRDEKGKRLYAIPLTEPELGDSMYERVHFWGAKTKPGIGQIQEFGVLYEGGNNHIYIKDNGNKCHQGDSGAMFLKENHRRESTQTLQAVGTFMGETCDEDEGRKLIATPLHLGLAVLSETHNATFSLFGEDAEEYENSQ